MRAAALLRTRWLVRTPVWLYRAGLGIVLGSRFVMLEHTGRKTGARRCAVLEVIGYPAPGRYLIVSGFGGRAQWYRNIRANPGPDRLRAPSPARLDCHQATAHATLGGTENEPPVIAIESAIASQ